MLVAPILGLYGMMLIIMLLRVALPIGVKIEGKLLREIRLSWSERLQLQRTNVYLIGGALLLGSVAGWLPTIVELMVVVAAMAILAIPVRYRLTDQGIALNHVVFRSWKEFKSVEADRRGLCLDAQMGFRDFSVVIAASRRGEVQRLLEAALTRANRGKASRKEVRPVALPSTTASST